MQEEFPESFFDRPVNRRGTSCCKWDEAPEGVTPMWIADMDFETAPCVKEAIGRVARQGHYGYTHVPDRFREAVCSWLARHGHWRVEPASLLVTTGVVPAISCILRAATLPGESVLIPTPAYNCFFSSVRNMGCQVLESPLALRDGRYSFNWDDLEQKASQPKTTAMILCSPHNPGGRVWRREELVRIADLCARHDVLLISDEIHCGFVRPGYTHIPTASVSEAARLGTVTCVSMSKSFNIAGLQNACIVCEDPALRRRIERAINIHEVCDVNPFGVAATVAACEQGDAWLAALNRYLDGNAALLERFFAQRLPAFPAMPLEGTYLAWIDARSANLSSGALEKLLVDRARVWLSAGSHYGAAGEGWLRLNLACQRPVLAESLGRIEKVLRTLA